MQLSDTKYKMNKFNILKERRDWKYEWRAKEINRSNRFKDNIPEMKDMII